MKRSIVIKQLVITTSIVILTEIILMFTVSQMVRKLVINVFSSYVSYASNFCADLIDTSVYQDTEKDDENSNKNLLQYTPDDDLKKEFREYYQDILQAMCEANKLKYVYIIQPDPEKGTVTYLALASEDKTGNVGDIVPGTVRKRELSPAEKSAFEGNENCIEETDNQYGHVISSFYPLHNSKTNMVDAVIGADVSIDEAESTCNRIMTKYFIILTVILILMLLVLSVVLRYKLVRPVIQISRKMLEFTEDHDAVKSRMEVRGKDEFAQMAGSFNTMTDEIVHYISDIESLNREKNMQEAEMSIAANIQSGLLPEKRAVLGGAVIRADMHPAKEIGGDFYDYTEMPDGRIFVCIADVSGKGISAALFMSRTITILRQAALMGYSPKDILDSSNKSVCLYNTNMMFVTVFAGIFDPATRVLTYSNAGHNIPYILSDELIPLSKGNGAAIGLFDDEEYINAEIQLRPGDSLFLYTDGINEAVNDKNEFFGNERLESALMSIEKDKRTETIDRIKDGLKAFVGSAAQSDDVTMLSMTVCSHHELALSPDKKELKKINELILTDPYIPKDKRKKLCLAAEEIFVNICSYAFDDTTAPDEKPVSFTMDTKESTVMVFTDSGKPFDPLSEGRDSVDDYDIDNEIGGLGIFLTRSIAEECHYEYKDGKNILTIIISGTCA